MIRVVNYKYIPKPDSIVIDTTSRSKNWSRQLSPFFAGPVNLYNNYISLNVENGWQFCKVFHEHVDDNENPTQDYFEWAQKGWNDSRAHRYPMGKDIKPLYSYWNGQKLSYVEARKNIYIPLYSKAVQQIEAFDKLKLLCYESNRFDDVDLVLKDFDGYDHKSEGLSYEQVINDPNRKMGHAFVLAMLLEGYIS